MTAVLPAAAGALGDGWDWRVFALCAQTDSELFFPVKGQPGKEAKALCQRCDVRAECLADALALPVNQDRWGVRGGLSATERQQARRSS